MPHVYRPHSRIRAAIGGDPALTAQWDFAMGPSLQGRKGPTLTFTRNSNATLWNSSQELRFAQHNYMEETDDLTAASTIESVGSFADNGDGSFRFTTSGTANNRWRQETAIAVEAGRAFFVTVKCKDVSGDNNFVAIEVEDSGNTSNSIRQWYDISNGTVSSNADTGTGNTLDTEVSGPDADGFYTIKVAGELTSATTNYNVMCWITSAGGSFACVGSGTTDFKEPQFGYGQSYLDYLENTGTAPLYDQPRFDHDPSDGTALGLLIEEARTNVCLQSEALGTTWTNPGSNTTITNNAGVAPDGNTTAEDVLHGDTAETIQQTITATDNTVYTISAFVKQGTTGSHDFVKISWIDESAGDNGFEAWFNISTGAVGTAQATGTGSYTASSAKIQDVGSGWYRISAAGQIPSGQTDARFEIINTTADAVDTAEATNSVFWWGAQAEEGSFPTSYIPTTTASVTRAADACSTTDLSWFNVSEGAYFVKALSPVIAPNQYLFYVHDGSVSESHILWSGGSGIPKGSIFTPGDDADADGATNWVADTISKQMAAYQEDDFQMYFDGGASTQDTSVDISLTGDFDLFQVGNRPDAARAWNGWIQEIKYYNVRKSDAFLQSETA